MVFFVTNNQFAFAQIEQSLAVDIFSLWKSCDFFLNFDKTLPSSLKLHLLDLETDIIMSKIWRDENAGVGLMLHRFTNTEGEKPSGGSEKEDLRIFFTDRLFRRLLHQTACQINQICVTLRLEEGIS